MIEFYTKFIGSIQQVSDSTSLKNTGQLQLDHSQSHFRGTVTLITSTYISLGDFLVCFLVCGGVSCFLKTATSSIMTSIFKKQSSQSNKGLPAHRRPRLASSLRSRTSLPTHSPFLHFQRLTCIGTCKKGQKSHFNAKLGVFHTQTSSMTSLRILKGNLYCLCLVLPY